MDGSVKNLLEAEQQATLIITAAQEERKANLQNAKTSAQQRINVVQQAQDEKRLAQENELQAKAEQVREQAGRVNDELDAIDNQFNGNRDQVIDTLLQAVMNVELEVPRVVKQNFVIAAEEWE